MAWLALRPFCFVRVRWEGIRGVLLTCDEFLTGVEHFENHIRPLMNSRSHVNAVRKMTSEGSIRLCARTESIGIENFFGWVSTVDELAAALQQATAEPLEVAP
jgi:hypothetical protein